MVKKALIIAAGFGSRLKRGEGDIPKPLRKVAGLRLIERILLSAKKAGLVEVVIVVGYQKERIIKALEGRDLGIKVQFVENPEWQKSNGISVLAAKEVIRENFILLMSDHIFDPLTLENLRHAPLGANKALLAVDYKLDSIFDMDDATKVWVEKNQIQHIGKELSQYNAVDSGMFLATPELFDALEEVKKDGNCSLSDGIRLLASRNEMGTFDLGDGFWQDVDTPQALQYAEKHLFQACRKPTDGAISRHFNRYISLFITRLIAKTNLTANQVTAVTSVVGIMSGVLVMHGDYWNVLWGAVLFKLSSILDGCDGELSKLKLSSSKLGQWLDTISDNFTYLCFFSGLVFGLIRRGDPHAVLAGSLALFGLAMLFLVMFVYLIRHTNSGSLLAIQQDFKAEASKSGWRKFLSSIQFMVKRDFFAVFFLVLALMNQLPLMVWLVVLGSNAMWMVLFFTKLGLFKQSEVASKNSSV